MSDSPSWQSDQGNVTMTDIAREVGVTAATVSLALKNHPRISEFRRKEIQKAAKRMGYRPNAVAASLAHHRHQSRSKPTESAFAWLNGWPESARLRQHPQFAAYWKGASEAAGKFGYRLEEFIVHANMPLLRIERILRTRNINGILVPPHAGIDVAWNEFDWSRFSVVRFGRTADKLPPFHVVTADQAGNAYRAFEEMTALGYERIGFAGVSERTWRGLAGYSQAQYNVPKHRRVPPLLYRFWEGKDDAEKPLRWIERHRPDAILIEHGLFLQHLQPLGFAWPRDFGLATTAVPDVPIDTGIDQNPEEIGRVAVLALLSQIRDNARGIPKICRQILVEGNWVTGGSSLPRKTAPKA